MKIILLSNLFPNPIERFRGMFNWHIANHLSTLGNDVKVVSPLPYFPAVPILKFMDKWYKFSQIPSEAVFGEINAYYPKYPIIPRISESFHAYLMMPFLYRALKTIQRNFGIDVVNAHYLYPDGVAACQVCRILKIPVVLSALGSDVNVLAQNKGISRQIVNALTRCSAITAVSDDLALNIRKFGISDRNIHVLRNGVDLSLFTLLDRKYERKKASVSDEDKIILFVGRLSPEKGIDYLLKAVMQLKTKWPKIRVFLVGGGPDLMRLKELQKSLDITELVHFIGEQTPSEICRWLGISDVLCLPSIREGCPNVILESFAAGRPVVGSNVGGIPEMIDVGRNGFLFQSGDANDLAQKLDMSLRFVWVPAEIRNSVENRSWSNVSQSYLELYYRAIETTMDIVI